jgi:hypothetical protein
VATTPTERLARLARHGRLGWQRSRGDAAMRERARKWLLAHPSRMPSVDGLWLEALEGLGPLAAWLGSDATPDSWHHDLALHSVLAGHPFPDLLQWNEIK